MPKVNTQYKVNAQYIENFEKIESQLDGLYTEIQSLTKKSPTDPLNKFKLRYVGVVIDAANELLTEKQRPFANFTRFDEDDLPTNSDVLMILRQYLNCMEEVRSDNIELKYGNRWYWVIGGEMTDINARPPAKLSNK